jgi:hypothetical protein
MLLILDEPTLPIVYNIPLTPITKFKKIHYAKKDLVIMKMHINYRNIRIFLEKIEM